MRAAPLALAVAAACVPLERVPRNARAGTDGVSIAIYEGAGGGYGVVDDRRWVDIGGRVMILADVDPGAELASLVIEPANSALRVGTCTRERLPAAHQAVSDALAQQRRQLAELRRRLEDIAPGAARELVAEPPPARDEAARFAPIVRCDVTGPPGRHLVRVVYVSSMLRYRGQHDVDLTRADRATVTSRYAVATPPWGARGDVVLFDGLPGDARAPREIARGPVALDGSTAILPGGSREVAAVLRRVYDGAVTAGHDPRDVLWGQDSTIHVWVWLELAGLRLGPGSVRVHLDVPGEGTRDHDVAPAARAQDDRPGAPLRLPLWIDESLRGHRVRAVEYSDADRLVEQIALSVGNTGDVPVEVFVEEPLRPARRRAVEQARPRRPTAAGDRLRVRVEVQPGTVQRVAFTLIHEF